MPQSLMTDAVRERRVAEQVLIPQLSLQSMFWRPKFTDDSPWQTHVPVAFWLIEAHHPQRVVELGCDEPVAYFAFCQALERLNPLCESLAFSTQPPRRAWLDYNDGQYQEFSSLHQATEQQALRALEDGDVDLIHVSPSAADAVLKNWEAWERKLSPSGLVVISQAQGRSGASPGAELFRYLKGHHPHFLFEQGAGLGLVAVGEQQSDVLTRLLAFSPRDPSARLIQQVFTRLGLACAPVAAPAAAAASDDRGSEEAARAIAERDERIRELATLTELLEDAERRGQEERQRRELAEQERADEAEARQALAQSRSHLEKQLAAASREQAALKEAADKARADLQAEVSALKTEVGTFKADVGALRAELQERTDDVASQQAALGGAQARVASLEAELKKEQSARQAIETTGSVEREQSERRLAELRERVRDLEAKNRFLQAEQAQRFEEIVQLTRMLEEGASAEPEEVMPERQANRPPPAEAPPAARASKTPRLVERFVVRGKDVRKLKRQAQLIQASGLFDAQWYLATYPDVRQSGMPPLEHFLRLGGQEGKSPGPRFDSHWYLTEYLDVAESGMNPLLHYVKFGKAEQRLPTPGGIL